VKPDASIAVVDPYSAAKFFVYLDELGLSLPSLIPLGSLVE